MSQNDFALDNISAPAARADISAAFQALASASSGPSAPATTYADMLWYDTTNNQLKKRNEANSAWIVLGTVDETSGTFEPNQTFASNAEALAGLNNTKAMTALRTAEAIAASSGYNAQVFTASGTWTKPVNAPPTAMVRFEIWGAGGGGGRMSNYNGNGAGGGGYHSAIVKASDLAATIAVVVGAGGLGKTGSYGNGANGGTSSFGVYEATGGSGGSGSNTGTNPGDSQGIGGDAAKSGVVFNTQIYTGGGLLSPDVLFGGGAGAAYNDLAAGISGHGGSGGTSGVNGGVGNIPGGGGAGNATNTNGSDGARGEVRIYTTW